MQCSEDTMEDLIALVSQPSRYLGGEINAVRKDLSQVDLRICLAFPDVYEVGMSHLGLQILYHLLNARPDTAAERVYAPGLDMEQVMRERGRKLTSLESAFPVGSFDLVGFSLQYELSYTTILNMLDLAGIPLYASEREQAYPLVIGGGPCALNPEPLADFFDAFVIGDGEEVMQEICDCILQAKKDNLAKDEVLKALSRIGGVYIPSFFRVAYRDDGVVREVVPLKRGYERVNRRWVTSLDTTPYIHTPIVPYKNIIHDRLNLEIARGCSRGCRFCQAGMIYRPVRERSLATLTELADAALASSGYGELSLSSLSTGDYTSIVPLLSTLMERYAARKIATSFPSLRSETLTTDLIDEIKKVRKTGFTIAPEAGTQRLRDVINKGITEEEIVETVCNVFDAGWNAIKLYFMVGLPTETDEDLRGIVALARRVSSFTRRGRRRGQVTVSVSTFVPKAHTPFQWEPQIDLAAMEHKQTFLKEEIRKLRLTFKWQNVWMSYLEGIFARGDRRLSRLITRAFHLGCRFDGWSEHLNCHAWKEALDSVDGSFYTTRARGPGEVFPWDHIASGVKRSFLWSEYQRGLTAQLSPGCRMSGCTGCGVCPEDKNTPEVFDRPGKQTAAAGSSRVVRADQRSGEKSGGNGGGYHRVRMQYSKLGKGRFLSHLEVLSVFSRALRRAQVSLRFSEGFHPLPRIVLGPALAVGIESRSEYVDVEVRGALDCTGLIGRVNRELPEWLRVRVAKEIPLKFPSISDSMVSIDYRFSVAALVEDHFSSAADLADRLDAFSRNATNYLEIKRKSGNSLIDLNQWLEQVTLKGEAEVAVRVKMSGGKTVGPYEVLRALLHIKALPKEKVLVTKTGERFRVGPFTDC